MQLFRYCIYFSDCADVEQIEFDVSSSANVSQKTDEPKSEVVSAKEIVTSSEESSFDIIKYAAMQSEIDVDNFELSTNKNQDLVENNLVTSTEPNLSESSQSSQLESHVDVENIHAATTDHQDADEFACGFSLLDFLDVNESLNDFDLTVYTETQSGNNEE